MVLGDGDREFHDQLQALRDKHPDQVGIYLGFNEALAHPIEAGARPVPDAEPVRAVRAEPDVQPEVRHPAGGADDRRPGRHGGERDARRTWPTAARPGSAFDDYTAHALYETVKWALTLYRDRPADFRQVVRTAMAQDWSWDRSAEAYEKLYLKVIAG